MWALTGIQGLLKFSSPVPDTGRQEFTNDKALLMRHEGFLVSAVSSSCSYLYSSDCKWELIKINYVSLELWSPLF